MVATAITAVGVKRACGRVHSANGNNSRKPVAWIAAVIANGSMRWVARLSSGAVQPVIAEPVIEIAAAAMIAGDGLIGPSRTTSATPAKAAIQPAILDQDGTRSDIGMYGGPYDVKPAPDGPDTVTETITGTVPHVLTVSGGYGGGSYLAGQIVHVWAAVDPATEYVTGWSGGTTSNDWSTTVVMPDADTTVTASKTAAALSFTDTMYTLAGSDRSVLTAIPSSPRGLVLFYHSAFGNNTEVQHAAASSIARRLYDDGYGIIAMGPPRLGRVSSIRRSSAWS